MKLFERPQAAYLAGAVLVWAALIAATAVTLGGTTHFSEMVPILLVGAIYFILIAPLGIWPTSVPARRPQSAPASWGRGSLGQLGALVRPRLHRFGLLGLIGLLGIPLHQPILFLFYLLFGLFAFAPRRRSGRHPRPR